MIFFPLIHAGEEEGKLEKIRSILAQLEYKYQIEYWEAKGVPFKSHIYVPENHPLTGMMFMEREDEGHVLKVSDYVQCACNDTELPSLSALETHYAKVEDWIFSLSDLLKLWRTVQQD